MAERWLLVHVVTYFLGSKSLTGGPLMLIIIKLLTLDNNSLDLLSVQTDKRFVQTVHETEAPFTLTSAARDGLHASYEWF